MKHQFKTVTITSLLILFVATITAQIKTSVHNKDNDTYLEFDKIINHYKQIKEDTNDLNIGIEIYNGTFGYLSVVTYSGKYRVIPKEKFNALKMIFKAFSFDYEIEEIFKYEVLITSNSGESYWLPIQSELLVFWKKELKKDDFVAIYTRALGSTRNKNIDRWIITINSFSADYYDELWDVALNNLRENKDLIGLSCLNKLIEINPKDGRNYSVYGYYYYNHNPNKEENIIKADSLYNISINLSPNYSQTYYQKAMLEFTKHKYSDAWKNIDKAKKLGNQSFDQSFIDNLESKLPYSEYQKVKN